ncbi:VOC family protein [Roseibium sp.]|uniref:VOC family protein n=1 Tax=Roseibium sp. TaxID=1936156 RepID=UPI003B526930
MIKLDHITVVPPTLTEGVRHVQDCLDIEVPFGTRHEYMGTHNHRLQLGDGIYLEIVAFDPDGISPRHSRWFGLDDPKTVRSSWDAGRRLRGWVASTNDLRSVLAKHGAIFGNEVPLPPENPVFAFAIPEGGSLPLDGAAPSLIDHRGAPTSKAEIPDRGAVLRSMTLEHPEPEAIERLYNELEIDRPPRIVTGTEVRYRAEIETPRGLKELT